MPVKPIPVGYHAVTLYIAVQRVASRRRNAHPQKEE